MIKVKRVYDPPDSSDGIRFLVNRLCPRGLKRESLQLKDWLKEVAPASELRQWFKHNPAKWDEFRRRYFAELDKNPAVFEPIVRATQ